MKHKQLFYDNIEPYLLGQLSALEEQEMLDALNTDRDLAVEVELRRLEFDVSEALIAKDIKAQFHRLQENPDNVRIKTPSRDNRFKTYLFMAIVLGLCVLTFILVKTCIASKAMQAPEIHNDSLMEDTLKREQIKDQPIATKEKLPSPSGKDLSPSKGAYQPLPENKSNTKDIESTKSDIDYLAIANDQYIPPKLELLTIGVGNSEAATMLNMVIGAFEQKNYARAAALAETIKPNTQEFQKAKFIQGNALYLMGEYEAASKAFNELADGKVAPYSTEAEWYGLLAMVAAGEANSEDFKSRLNSILKNKGGTNYPKANQLSLRLGLPLPQEPVIKSGPTPKDCEAHIASNNGLDVESRIDSFISRGKYAYLIKVSNNAAGIWVTIYSIGGEVFNYNDEIIFINDLMERRSFRFLKTSLNNSGAVGSCPLSIEDVKWLAHAELGTAFIKNNQKNQMLKFTIDPERKANLFKLMNCFWETIK